MESAHHEVLGRLRALLDVGDDARPSFVEWLTRALGAIPPSASSRDAYVRPFPPADAWMGPYEQVPDWGRDPGDVVHSATSALAGVMRTGSSYFLHNITPPVATPAAALGTVATLYNPNALWDLVSGGTLSLERQLARQLARLAGWSTADADGATTFGGKAGLIYAIRLGLNRCAPTASTSGLVRAGGRRPVVLTTDQNHYTIRSVCSLLGLGTDAVIDVPTDSLGRMLPDALVDQVLDAQEQGHAVAAVILCGGNTLDGVVDPISEICRAIEQQRLDERLGYRPWVHVDLPVGWPWLFFRSYDEDANRLGLPPDGLALAMQVARALDGIERADSFTVDFHKLGFCPYQASMFVARSWRELRRAFRPDEPAGRLRPFGENPMQHHTIEHSRSSAPILAAWATLQILGADGFRSYLAHCHHLTAAIRRHLRQSGLSVVNASAPSLATLVTVDPPAASPWHGDGTTSADRYVEALYRYASGLDGGVAEPIALGFVPGYRPPGGGPPVAAIRWYVANPALDDAGVAAAVAHFVGLKQSFDLVSNSTRRQPPAALRMSHTPR